MSHRTGSRLPLQVAADIGSASPPLRAVPVVCIDSEGFSHPALLSLLEFLLVGERLYFHLHEASRSRRFLLERPCCTCLFVSEDACCYVKGETRFHCGVGDRAVFELSPRHVLQDTVPAAEGRTHLLSGLNFSMSPERLQSLTQMRARIARSLA